MGKTVGHPVDRHVGARLRHFRSIRGMSQTDLGRAVDLTFQQIQKYETGANRISASKLFEFAAALGVDVRAFFDDLPAAGPGGQRAARQPPGLSPLDAQLVNRLPALADDDLKRKMIALVDAVIAEQTAR